MTADFDPAPGTFDEVMGVIGATVILVVGLLIAGFVRTAIRTALERVGIEYAAAASKLAYGVLILVPVIVGSLNALQIEAVTKPASDMLNTILATLPDIFAAALVIGIAYVVGRVVCGMAVTVLNSVGFDKLPARLGIAAETSDGGRTPSEIAGVVILVAIVLFATMQALPMLGFDLLAGMMSDFLAFAGHVLVGLAILGFGLYFAKLVDDLIRDSAIANAALLANVARIAILVLAIANSGTGLKSVLNVAGGRTTMSVSLPFRCRP